MTSDNDTRQTLKAVNTSFAYEVQFFFLISVLLKNLRIHREIINKKKYVTSNRQIEQTTIEQPK